MKYYSPLRYPGGKAALSDFLADIIELNDLHGCAYFEPYAGGAGAAITLLKNDIVSELFLNDADFRIYAFWHAILNCTDHFVEKIASVPLTIEEWHRQRYICEHPNSHDQFEVGFSAFFMNRCNRSGVLTGAGPIGGKGQTGTWRIDVRFNREALVERILRLGKLSDKIHFSKKDAIDFLKTDLPRGRRRSNVFVYLDPPYVNKSQRLYLNIYDTNDHRCLSSYLYNQRKLPWVMSYDDSELIRKLYENCRIAMLSIRYTLQAKRQAHELIIAPYYLAVPSVCRTGSSMRPLQAIA